VAAGPDDLRGETPVAFVVAQPGLDDDDVVAAVLAAVEENLASYQRPRRVIVRESLPRDPTGKLLRHLLRAELWEGQESIFAAPAVPQKPATS
jgi:acyl-coenzyme A synthetase/AMP-(fatty) acid ligase